MVAVCCYNDKMRMIITNDKFGHSEGGTTTTAIYYAVYASLAISENGTRVVLNIINELFMINHLLANSQNAISSTRYLYMI